MRKASTDAATTASASRSTSSFPRSITTRPRRCGAWTSWCAPRRTTTRKPAPCSRHSTSRSGSEERVLLKRGHLGDLDGEEEFDREEQSAAQAGEEIFRAARAAQGHRARQ